MYCYTGMNVRENDEVEVRWLSPHYRSTITIAIGDSSAVGISGSSATHAALLVDQLIYQLQQLVKESAK